MSNEHNEKFYAEREHIRHRAQFIEGDHFVDAHMLTWEARHGSAEISDLGPGFRVHQIWNDSCDTGFTMLFKHTKNLRTFVEHHQERDGDDITAWVFISLDPSTGRIDTTPRALTVTLFND